MVYRRGMEELPARKEEVEHAEEEGIIFKTPRNLVVILPREDGFDIVVASEVMAILCLSTSINDLKERLGEIVVGYSYAGEPVRARDLKAQGAMAALL